MYISLSLCVRGPNNLHTFYCIEFSVSGLLHTKCSVHTHPFGTDARNIIDRIYIWDVENIPFLIMAHAHCNEFDGKCISIGMNFGIAIQQRLSNSIFIFIFLYFSVVYEK